MSNTERIIYPAYINKSRTVARGRRIPLQHAVADPKPQEVVDALMSLKGFQAKAEAKPYPRELDKESVPWRVRYINVNPDKNNLRTKREIMVGVSKKIGEIRSKSQQNPEGSGKSKKKNK